MKVRKYLLFREIVERKDERKEEDGLAGLAGKKKLRRQRKRKVSTSDTGICLFGLFDAQ